MLSTILVAGLEHHQQLACRSRLNNASTTTVRCVFIDRFSFSQVINQTATVSYKLTEINQLLVGYTM